MFNVVRHLDPVVGLDVHTVFIPPSPVPIPIPHPHVGAVLDLREQVNSICPAIGAAVNFIEAKAGMLKQLSGAVKNPLGALIGMASSEIGNAVASALCGPREPGGNEPIKVNGMLRSTVGTHSFHLPGLHFPLGTGFAPPDPLPSRDAESFMGSKTVLANGDPLSYMALPSMSCWFVGLPSGGKNSPHTNRSHLSLPTSVQLPIPLGRPVVAGGMPVPDMSALVAGLVTAVAAKGLSALASKVQKKVTDRKNQKKADKNKTENECKTDPVNVVTGEVVVDDLDFVVAGRVPLVWGRSYGGQYDVEGQIGHHWESLADTRLEVSKEDNQLIVVATFFDYETAFSGFPLYEGWEHRVYDGQNGHALYLQQDRLILRTHEQLEYAFPVNPYALHQQLIALPEQETLTYYLSQLADRLGNGWVFERDTHSLLNRITEVCLSQPTGRYIACANSAAITGQAKLTDLVLRHHEDSLLSQTLVQYRYDDEDNLAAVLDANGYAYSYRYTEGHLMTQHTNRNGFSFYYHYQPQSDGVARVVKAWADDNSYTYQFVYHRDRQETLTTDSRGHTEILQYDDRYLPIVCIDALGGVTSYEYDGLCRLICEVDPSGHKTEWHYDYKGRIVEERFADGASIKAYYDEYDNLIARCDPLTNRWQQEFNAMGLVVLQRTPQGAERHYHYAPDGQLSLSRDAEGRETRYHYDRYGFLVALMDPVGQQVRFKRDWRGNIIETLTADGEVTVYRYNHENQPIYCQYPDNRTLACQYDPGGNLIKLIENGQIETHFRYWGVGVLTERINPDQSVLRYHYDTEGDLVAVENQKGQQWQLKRDALGRVHEEVDYWGKSRHYYYDPAGHLLESLDPLGNRLRVTCDKVGRIISKIANDRPESQETFRYDKRGLMVSAVNPAMSVSRQYDADGLLRQECQQQTALKAVLDYQYDRSHRLLTQHHRISNGHQLQVEQQLTYQYDEVGRLMSQQVDEHQPIRFAYDRQGRLISQRFTSSLAGNFSYNLSGQLQQQCWRQDEHQIDHTDYYYDEQGNLTQRDDSVVGTDRYFYDQAGQIIRHMDPMHQIHQWVYDATGDRYQTNAGNDGNEQGRQLSFSHNIHYRLDAAGQLVYRSSPTAQSELSWDAHGRLTAFTQENKTTHYQYDALRRRINKQLYNRQGQLIKTVYFIWDGDALVAEVTIDHSPHVAQPIAQIACFVYYPNSFVPLVLQNKQQGIGSLAPPEETGYYFYQTDPNGMPLRLRDEQGEVVWLAHYSTFGQVDRLYQEKVTQPLRLQGQYFDEESGLHYNRHRYYDPEVGVFISADPIGLLGGVNPYQYAPNIFGWVDPLGLTKCIANKIIDNAKNGKIRRGKDYHGRLGNDLEQNILSNPQSVYQSKNGNLIFYKDGNIVVTHGKGGAQGNIITSYGHSGPRGESGASIYGGTPSDPGLPVTRDMILKGEIPRPRGGYIPPATEIPLGD